MITFLSTFRQVFVDRRGVTALEYGLIAALIACAIIVSTANLGTKLKTQFTDIAAKITY